MDFSKLVSALLGSYSTFPWIGLLILIMTIDIISGLFAAVSEKKLSSKIGYKGMMKKCSMILVVATSYLFELQILSSIPEALRPETFVPFAKIVAGFFFIVESLSVLENAKRCGVPLPSFLSKSLIDTMNKLSQLGQPPEVVKVETKTTITHEPTITPTLIVTPEPKDQK